MIHTFFVQKDQQHSLFECYFLRDQLSSNGLQRLLSWTLNFTGLFAKKLGNLLFSENVVIRQSSSKHPSFSVHTARHFFKESVKVTLPSISSEAGSAPSFMRYTTISRWPCLQINRKKKLVKNIKPINNRWAWGMVPERKVEPQIKPSPMRRVSMTTLWVATTRYCHTGKQWKLRYLPHTYQAKRVGGLGVKKKN